MNQCILIEMSTSGVNILNETILFLHLLGRCCEQVRGVVHLVEGVDHLLLHPAAYQHVTGLVEVKPVPVGLPRAQHCHTEHFRIITTKTTNILKLFRSEYKQPNLAGLDPNQLCKPGIVECIKYFIEL